MKWILVIVWYSYYGYNGVTMQEFDSLKDCQWASTQVNDMVRNPVKMRCVPKGDIK